MKTRRSVIADQYGQNLFEYALMLALIAMIAFLAVTLSSTLAQGFFRRVASWF